MILRRAISITRTIENIFVMIEKRSVSNILPNFMLNPDKKGTLRALGPAFAGGNPLPALPLPGGHRHLQAHPIGPQAYGVSHLDSHLICSCSRTERKDLKFFMLC
jgi:hypothetical protein